VVDGLERPIGLTHAGDGSGRLFVNEQAGRVLIIEPDGAIADEPFLDIRDRVSDRANEQGLLGLVFHPDFAENGRLFVHYTGAGGETVLAELAASGGVADPDSEQVLLRIDQPAGNHNGGQLAFGHDGLLYLALGDGGGGGDQFGNGQNPFTLLGTILRLNVSQPGEYAIPDDNPFADGAEGAPEIWAWGLRNPWRFSFDGETGDLFIADVGQSAWEEINRQPADSAGGENYGWPVLEGSHCFREADCDRDPYVGPIAEYANDAVNCSVTGGYVHRGPGHPALNGSYLFGDYCSGFVFLMTPDELAGAVPDEPLEPRVVAESGARISAFGQDEDGEVFVVDHGGAVYRITARTD
jgi:glucose/arabinose dehydrogenase